MIPAHTLYSSCDILLSWYLKNYQLCLQGSQNCHILKTLTLVHSINPWECKRGPSMSISEKGVKGCQEYDSRVKWLNSGRRRHKRWMFTSHPVISRQHNWQSGWGQGGCGIKGGNVIHWREQEKNQRNKWTDTDMPARFLTHLHELSFSYLPEEGFRETQRRCTQ